MPVIVPIFKAKGLSMEQIFQLQAIFSIVVAFGEIPSGYISDLFSRKNTLILSAFFYFLGELGFLVSDNFYHLAIAEIFLGLSLCLYSGTDISLVYDSIEQSPKEEKLSGAEYLSKLMFWGLMGESIGGLMGGYLAGSSLDLVLKVNAVVAFSPILVALFLKEPPRKKMDSKAHWQNIKYVYKELITARPFVRQILIFGVVYSIATITAAWSSQELWTDKQIPIHYFGYLWALVNIVGAFSSRFAYRAEAFLGPKKALYIIGCFPIVAFGLMGSPTYYPALIACVLFQCMRGFNSVIIKDALNSRVGAEYRATANSVLGMGFRICFAFTGPLFGYVVDKHNIQIAYYLFAGLFVLAFFFVLIPLLSFEKEFRTGS